MKAAVFSIVVVVITVTPILPRATAQDMQWLAYRSAREASRVVGDMDRRRLDLADEKPDVAERLRAQLADWLERVDAKIPQPNPDYVAPAGDEVV